MKKRFIGCIFLCLYCNACNPTSLEDFQHEGAAQSRLLLRELRNIENREDLSRAEPILKKRFEKIVDLMIQARTFQQKHPEEEPAQCFNEVLNGSLIEELERVFSLEGGREAVERAQREAMIRLDAHERSLEKQRTLKLK
jgi:hypothetical protein